MKAVRKLCDETGTLLIFDEIQTGMGLLRRVVCHQADGVSPDIMTLAKALGNGLPIGAMLATAEAATGLTTAAMHDIWRNPPGHGCCFDCDRYYRRCGIPEKSPGDGDYFRGKLEGLKEKYSQVKEIRGKGLLLGMELEKDAGTVVQSPV